MIPLLNSRQSPHTANEFIQIVLPPNEHPFIEILKGDNPFLSNHPPEMASAYPSRME